MSEQEKIFNSFIASIKEEASKNNPLNISVEDLKQDLKKEE